MKRSMMLTNEYESFIPFIQNTALPKRRCLLLMTRAANRCQML